MPNRSGTSYTIDHNNIYSNTLCIVLMCFNKKTDQLNIFDILSVKRNRIKINFIVCFIVDQNLNFSY